MLGRFFLLVVLSACGSSTPAALPEPETPEKPPAAPEPPDTAADCTALDEIFATFKHPAAETPSEADLVRYYGNLTKAFREVRLSTPALRIAAKDITELFTNLGGRAEAIMKAFVALDAAMQAKNKSTTELFDGMRSIWLLREQCDSPECKKLHEIEKAHHAVVRMPLDDLAVFRAAVRAFKSEINGVTAVDRTIGFARGNMEKALTSFEESSVRLAEAQAALDDVVRAKESKKLRGRLLGYCPQLGERR